MACDGGAELPCHGCNIMYDMFRESTTRRRVQGVMEFVLCTCVSDKTSADAANVKCGLLNVNRLYAI